MPHPKTCAQCGKDFVADKSTRIFCSYACSGASRRRKRQTLTCVGCGDDFTVKRAYRAKEAKYCSHQCYLDSCREESVCPQCGGRFVTQVGRPQTFCSNRCNTLSQRKRVMITCDYCGKKKSRTPSSAQSENTFCSPRCARAYQREQRVKIVCDFCNNDFEVIPSQLNYRDPRFCSLECYRKHSGESGPETKVRATLEEMGVPFEQEHPILSYFVDFFLTDCQVALEVDGEYWHRNRQKHDAKRDSDLLEQGVPTIRIAEEEINGTQDIHHLVLTKLDGYL